MGRCGVTRVFGHRGASADRPENTVAAFLEAARQGADGVELDVRRSADGALVVHHDAEIPGAGPIVALAATELPPDVPLLAEALDACAGLEVNIEIKNWPDDVDFDPTESVAAAVVALVHELGMADRVLVSSFHLGTVDRVRDLDPSLARGLLTVPTADQRRALEVAAERGHQALHPHHLVVNADLVAAAHGLGLALNTWTVDDPERIRWLAACGVDIVITNSPAVAVGALRTTTP